MTNPVIDNKNISVYICALFGKKTIKIVRMFFFRIGSKITTIVKKSILSIQTIYQTIKTFNATFYLQSYQDVPNRKLYAYLHFIRHGRTEGRLAGPPPLKNGAIAFCDKKETILIISHDASRTGAPILALNLCIELNKQFNVIALLLRDGNISPFFETHCYKIMKNGHIPIMRDGTIEIMIEQITKQYQIKFCIVNSIESCSVLAPLANNFIPSLLLIHEFLAYTRPVNKFETSFFWAGKAIFPAKIVQQNAINSNTIAAVNNSHILPQGKSYIPFESNPAGPFKKYDSNPFVVLGAGSIHYRKGVDLFIATAAEIKRLHPDYNIKMLWVGGDFNPEHDIHYSCYLAEQIERSDLRDCFEIMDEVSDLERLYKTINLFFLSSRLDPLPNVAIDVMMLGIPVICFKEGTGIAEFLEQDEDTSTCVVPHMSTIDSAKKIIQLYESSEHYDLIAEKTKLLAHKHFNMRSYASKLVELAEIQCKISEQEALDCTTLENSADFIAPFSMPDIARSETIRRYVRSWHSGIHSFRKPAPGFNRILYDVHHHCKARSVEPFADYIRTGKPTGPWQDEVITASDITNQSSTQLTCAVHIHAFYPDLLDDILNRLKLNHAKYDLFVSVTETNEKAVSDILSNSKENYQLHVVPNKGRDIGPFLTAFGKTFQQYDLIAHIHTKKSLDLKNDMIAQTWMNFLLENLLGGQYKMMDQIISRFQNEPNLGLIFADDPNLWGWNDNKIFAEKLAFELGLSQLPEDRFNYPLGTMFWARPNALKPLFDLGWTWDMYPEEPLPYDGSVLHAIERLIPVIVAHQGFKQAVTYVPGVTR